MRHLHTHNPPQKTNTHPTRHTKGTSIYLQRRPFHPDRFADFVEALAVASYSALENAIEGKKGEMGKDVDLERVVTGLLRSKGFLWLACTDQAALYYSHAGKCVWGGQCGVRV